METSTNIHHGHNVKRIREAKGIKQDALAKAMGNKDWNQQRVSYYEGQPLLEEDILQQFAQALDVDLDMIKNMPEAALISIVNNSFKDSSSLNAAQTQYFNHKAEELYERMLKDRDNQIQKLESRVEKLEAELEKSRK